MKFIHTADWQLGMKFSHVQEKADALRRARIDVVKQILALAEIEKVDFVIAAGDLLDDNRISPNTVEEMAIAVSRSPVPVYLLPGNHDPLTQDSPYSRCPDLFRDSAIVLRNEESILAKGATLYPCPARSRRSNNDPTKWIPQRTPEDGIRIGIAHGSVNTPADGDFPIAQNAATAKGLDYLALGHWHGTKKMDEYTWYCGAPEATAFGQANAGNVLLVEICAPGTKPKVKEVEVARFKWQELFREVHTEDDVNSLLKELEATANPLMLLALHLTGSLAQPQLDLIEKYESERYFYLKKSINVALDPGTWEYKHKLLKGIAEVLAADTAQEGEEAEIARRALSKLNFLVKMAGFRGEVRKDAH